MNENNRKCRHRSGPTIFWMQDANLIFSELELKKGDCFLDVGCGAGDYALEAAKVVGETGKVCTFSTSLKIYP